MLNYAIIFILLSASKLSSADLGAVLDKAFSSTPASRAATVFSARQGSDNEQSCTTRDNRPGFCVMYYLCNDNNTIKTDGADVIDVRMGAQCDNYLDVCCSSPDDARHSSDQTTPHLQHTGCGWRNTNGLDTGSGEENDKAKFGEFPWMVAILREQPLDANDPNSEILNVYVGGGSLIHPSVVLTAAHQVVNKRRLRVRAGEWDTEKEKALYPFQSRQVSNVVINGNFNKGNLIYDIALLFLSSPMKLAPNVSPICLPSRLGTAPSGARCFATGWGKDKFGDEGEYQAVMKKVELPVVEKGQCQSQLRQTRLGRFFKLNRTFMCAGGEPGRDTCTGDGGSPLACPIENQPGRYMASGLVAWGIGCGSDGTPGVYVDVAVLRYWVDAHMIAAGLDPSSYTF